MKFRKAFLHIGLGKTGSTAIQTQLLHQVQTLESSCDVHFPHRLDIRPKFNGNHSFPLRAICEDSATPGRSQRLAGFTTPEQASAYADSLRAMFERGFAKTSARNLLLSAEGIGHFEYELLVKLADWLSLHTEHVVIIACVRHPISALSSEIQQRLKIGHTLEELYANPPGYKLKALFTRLEQAFPGGRMHLYDFADALEHPQGPAGAFIDQLGIELPASETPPEPSNTSMSQEAAELLSALNRVRPVLIDGSPNPRRSGLDLQRLMKVPGRKFRAPPEVYDRLSKDLQEHLDWLRDTHHMELRCPDLEFLESGQDFSSASLEHIAQGLVDGIKSSG